MLRKFMRRIQYHYCGAGINTVAELVQRNQEDMMKVRNLGKKSLEEVEQKLIALGLSLKASDE